ncbi:MAG: TATA-box-binding protein [Candidatus Lokiarchaeota archaeon]|nr:TATA-box-binding protein [Candidatus Lokiarchaeota archaeon]MBD3338672.1 TATA-box-binding protein [Candidatus Lokiarchaeota archaeon]
MSDRDKQKSEEKSKENDDFDFKVENVVGTITLEIEEKIDLLKLARKHSEAEYNPERFPGIITRIPEPRATFLIFNSGKIVVTGLKQVDSADKAVEIIVKKIKNAGIKVENPELKIQNIVASANLHANIDLNRAAIMMDYAMYEPEVFPGLIYRMQDPKAVFLIFSSGKVICTGIKEPERAKVACKKLDGVIEDLELTFDVNAEPNYEPITFI